MREPLITSSELSACRSIFDRVVQQPTGAPIHVDYGLHGPSVVLTRARLLESANALANVFVGMGVQPGDRVLTLLPTGEAFLRTLFAAWYCRAAIVPVAWHPGHVASAARRAAAILRTAAPAVVIGSGEALNKLQPDAGGAALRTPEFVLESRPEGARLSGPEPEDTALVQFTSGSTSSPRGVLVTHRMLAMNMFAAGLRMDIRPDDRMVSWLPMYHDMGLIGGICYPLFQNFPINLIPTERFAADPSVWLRSISEHRGTLSPGPNFAFEILAKRVPHKRLQNLDLKSWRYSNVGAEPIFPHVLSDFQSRFTDSGLATSTLHPSYGLAEATLAVSMAEATERHGVEWVSRTELQCHRVAVPIGSRSPDAIGLVSNGPPLEGIEVRISDENGEELPERHQGRILIRGPYVTPGYLGCSARRPEEWLDTGDLGVCIGHEMFITGRTKDLIIRSGVNTHPQDLERAVSSVPRVRQGCVVAFSRVGERREEVIVIAETRSTDVHEREQMVELARQAVVDQVGVQVDQVVFTAPGTLPKTTSGKPQRALTRKLMESGELPSHQSPRLSHWKMTMLWLRLLWVRIVSRFRFGAIE